LLAAKLSHMETTHSTQPNQATGTLRPRLFSFASGLVVAFLIAILTSAASPQLAVGVADDNAFMTQNTRGHSAAADLGLNTVRLFIWWKPGQKGLTLGQQQEIGWALAGNRRILASVTGQPLPGKPRWIRPQGVTSAAARRQYVAFLRDLVRKFPAIKDVSIWNEPNLSLFWANRYKAPQRYAALLAASYDALHPLRKRVYGFELHPWLETSRWLNGVGSWMRMTHRKKPVFDYVATHPYPMTRNEAPWAHHREKSILSMGDIQRLRGKLRGAFRGTAQKRLQVFYTETGWTTSPTSSRRVTPAQQATRMVQAVELAYCQRDVFSFITFLLADDPGEWQTGLITNGWAARKPAYAPYKAAIARIRAKKVKCARFPHSVR
jgi:hypothetical protein